MSTVTSDCYGLADYIEQHGQHIAADAEHQRQWAWELRNPTAETLVHNIELLLWCKTEIPPHVVWAAQRLQALIDSHTKRELAALLRAA